ncbi:MAG TPA: AI-2E family transporter [Anaerolineales bacterium]|nr:AI-2E family transporter [Anaerolineales bacterium]
MNNKLVKFGLAVMTALLSLIILWQFRNVVIYVMISLMLAAAMRPLVTRLSGKKVLIRLAWILLYLVILGGVGFLLFLSVEKAINEIQLLSKTLSVQDKWILPVWLQNTPFQQTLISRLPVPSKLFEAITGDEGQLVLPAILGFSQGLGTVVSGILIILFLSIYWSINQIHFERLWLSLLTSDQRKKARGAWRVIESDIGLYLRSEVTQSLLTGILLGLGVWLLGSPYPAFLALIGIFACLVPVVGIVLVVISVLLVGLLTSVPLGILTAVFALILFITLDIIVKKRLFKLRWENSILTVVLLIALADAFGVVGLLLAPPLSVACQVLWSRLVIRRTVLGAAASISDLKERQALLWDQIRNMDGPPLPLVTSSMERLADLIGKAEPLLPSVQGETVLEPSIIVPEQTRSE